MEYTETPPIFIQNPSIWIIDLKTRETIRRIDLTDQFIETANEFTGFSSITLDVDRDCENAFAYIPAKNKIITYSFNQNIFWVAGTTFSIIPNIISIALSKPTQRGLRTAYFHLEPTFPYDSSFINLDSRIEFSVSTTILKSGDVSYIQSNRLGIRDGDSYMHDIDMKSEVMFLTSYSRKAITCWDPSKVLDPKNMATIHQDDNTLNSTRDVQVDMRGFVWYLSTRFTDLVELDYNFRVFRFNAKNEIRDNVCNPRKNANDF